MAHAILTAAQSYESGTDLPPVTSFRSIAGRGAEGEIGGRRYLIGSPRLFAGRGIPIDEAETAIEAVGKAGETPVVLGDTGGPLAVFGLVDTVRLDARLTLDVLRSAGVEEFVMLTGDAEARLTERRRLWESNTGRNSSPNRRSMRCGIWSRRQDRRAWSATA